MFSVNISNGYLIERIEIPVLLVFTSEDESNLNKILIGSEINEASMQEIVIIKREIQNWLDENLKGKYSLSKSFIQFELEEDAVFFKTVWI